MNLKSFAGVVLFVAIGFVVLWVVVWYRDTTESPIPRDPLITDSNAQFLLDTVNTSNVLPEVSREQLIMTVASSSDELTQINADFLLEAVVGQTVNN